MGWSVDLKVHFFLEQNLHYVIHSFTFTRPSKDNFFEKQKDNRTGFKQAIYECLSIPLYMIIDNNTWQFYFFFKRSKMSITLLTKFLRPLVGSLNGIHDCSSKGIFFQTSYPDDGRTGRTADLIFELGRMLATDLT